MLKWLSPVLLAVILIVLSVTVTADEESKRQIIAEMIAELDADEFGADAVVVRDEHNEWRAVSVNGYPAYPVNAALNIRSTTETFRYKIDFVDYPFWRPATVYDGNLASMSLTMAMCANRALNLNQQPEKDFDPALNLERFFADAGFGDIRKDDYSKETSMYTVSTAMGCRRMEHAGEEPFTLIAVGVCGAFYKNEWQSNMTPGSGQMHEGFKYAADLVIDRISGYILTRGIKGRIKIWISGFSRAAAISNLVAGTLVRDGILPKEDVYAYTFATPAAVHNPPDKGYENIFNIISPMDLVPQVMPADWGFGRYGQDLFLPLTEFSTLGKEIMQERRQAALENFGIHTAYSPALNLRMRLLFSMLLEVLENEEHYNESFQPAVVGIMQHRNASNMLSTLRSVLLGIGESSDQERAAIDRLLNFVFRVFGNVFTRTELAATNTNSGSIAARMMNEHREDTYLACIDIVHKNLFDGDSDFTYVLIRGPVRVRVSCPDDPEIVETLSDGESDSEINAYEDEHLIYMERRGNVSILAVPHDLNYRVDWEATKNGTVEVRQAECTVHASARYSGAASSVMRVKAGDTGIAYEQKDGEASFPESFTAATFGAEDLASFLGIASMGVNWRIWLVGTNVLFGIAGFLLFCLIMRIQQKKWKPGLLFLFGMFLFFISVLETEMAFWFFADRIPVRAFWKAVTGISLIILFFCRHEPVKPLLHTLFPGLLMAILADIMICFSFMQGLLAFLLGHLLLIVAFLRREPMRRGKWIQWAVVSLLTSGLIVLCVSPKRGLDAQMVALYAPVLLLMHYCAGNRSPVRIRYATRIFLVSDLLFGAYALVRDPAIHVVYMLLFYLALLLMAIGNEFSDEKTECAIYKI